MSTRIRMETKMSTVDWQRPLVPLIFDIPYRKVDVYPADLQEVESNRSFLHPSKLRSVPRRDPSTTPPPLPSNDDNPEDEQQQQQEDKSLSSIATEGRRARGKKISFKIKKQSSLYRRNVAVARVTNVPVNKVAELTRKFNEMVENRNVREEQRVKRLVMRADSMNDSKRFTVNSSKVSRKPSVKTKPVLDGKVMLIKTITRKNSVKKQKRDESPPPVAVAAAIRPTTLNLKMEMPPAIIETSPNGTSVRAAIEIFEKKTSHIASPKPIIPIKSPALKTLIKISPVSPLQQQKQPQQQEQTIQQQHQQQQEIPKHDDVTSNEFAEDKVQIINIPAVLPQRRCDSMYETMTLKKVNPDSLKAKSVDNIIIEQVQPNSSFLWRDKSPSTASSRSSINTQFLDKLNGSGGGSNATTPDAPPNRKLPPDVPPKPASNIRTIKRKMPLPESPPIEEQQPDYEEIGGEVEKFKSYDEITKTVSVDVEIVEDEAAPSKHYEEITKEEKIYEELSGMNTNLDDGYEPIGGQKLDATENIYETLPVHRVRLRKQQPLPPRPVTVPSTDDNSSTYNGYESIYTKKEGHYESIYGSQLTTDSGSNRDSVLSSDHKSNSLYGQTLPHWGDCSSSPTYYKPPSEVSDRGSDRSDEWEDVTDNEEAGNHLIVVREKLKNKKSGWSQHWGQVSIKTLKETDSQVGDEPDHYYESLYSAKEEEDFDEDSFESDTESEVSFDKTITNDSGIDMSTVRLPDPPNTQSYGLMKFAGKNMRKIGKSITKSLTRVKKHISKTDPDINNSKPKVATPCYENIDTRTARPIIQHPVILQVQDTDNNQPESQPGPLDALPRTKETFLNKFRRSMSLSTENASELTATLNGSGGGTRAKSTFYLTEAIEVDRVEGRKSQSPVLKDARSPVVRPKSPPPPVPVICRTDLKKATRQEEKSASWYADSAALRHEDVGGKRPNTCWYAEVNLYKGQNSSTPSTSSAENSGSNLSVPIKVLEIPRPHLKTSDFINQDDNEHYNNIKNESPYYSDSVTSFGSTDTKKDESLKQEIQLRLQEEPLYQFYDAAVLDSNSYSDTSDFDSDNYEDVAEREVLKLRPSAMELVSPKRNSVCFTRTLWCEIPEVINSTVLSTLSPHQKKLQEAKFEILTSEASYLNSLNVLNNHFVKSFNENNILSNENKEILFGHVEEVRNSSEKLLHDLEKCWQDNILLHGICDIVQKHAEENFNVYVPYCENQVLFDDILKNLKDRLGFTEFLRHLELSDVCQSLSLYSFLMLPMQRITRWPLLVDAVLKRLPEQDSEYYACQYALATVNKIVNQCNEAARQKERETELLKVAKRLEFPQNVPKIPIISSDRWLVRCGPVVHMQSRNEDTKLTFGKRFVKNNIHLFLFNDLFLVTKEKSEQHYVVQQYCPRNLVELSTSEVMAPVKDTQGKHFIFLTMLENQDGKTVEYLLSCGSESDKERWIEALTSRKSEDPDETVYECWDCPQVTAIHNYVASQPDELALSKGDVINVLRKMADGWYHGERLRDGQTGWFPANYTVEVANIHVRARNLKQRYRLLAYSENYLRNK